MSSTQHNTPASPEMSVSGQVGPNAERSTLMENPTFSKPLKLDFKLSSANATPIRRYNSWKRARAFRRRYKLISTTGRFGCGVPPQLFRNAIINIMVENPVKTVNEAVQATMDQPTEVDTSNQNSNSITNTSTKEEPMDVTSNHQKTYQEENQKKEEETSVNTTEEEDKLLQPTPSEATSMIDTKEKELTEQEILEMLASDDEDEKLDPYTFKDEEDEDTTHLDFYDEEDNNRLSSSSQMKENEEKEKEERKNDLSDLDTVDTALGAMQNFLKELGEHLKTDTDTDSESEEEIKVDKINSEISYYNIAMFFKNKFERTNISRFQKLYQYYINKTDKQNQ
jgi:hypothetical protein